MSLADAFAAGLGDLIREFGEAVSYAPSGGEAVQITAAVLLLGDAPPSWIAERFDWDAATWARATVLATDLTAAPGRGDTLTDAAGTAWEVQAARPLGVSSSPAGYELACSRAEGVEV